MLEFKDYRRRSFDVTGVQITSENIREVAAWCGGAVFEAPDKEPDSPYRRYIRADIQNTINTRQTMGYVGDFVLKMGKGFKIYTPGAFTRAFESKDAPDQPLQDPRQEAFDLSTPSEVKPAEEKPIYRLIDPTGFDFGDCSIDKIEEDVTHVLVYATGDVIPIESRRLNIKEGKIRVNR